MTVRRAGSVGGLAQRALRRAWAKAGERGRLGGFTALLPTQGMVLLPW
jgi:hypothetical protein